MRRSRAPKMRIDATESAYESAATLSDVRAENPRGIDKGRNASGRADRRQGRKRRRSVMVGFRPAKARTFARANGDDGAAGKPDLRGGRSFHLRRLRPLGDSIANADELEDRPGAGVAEAGLGEPDDSRVAARAADESRGDGREEHSSRFLVSQHPDDPAAGLHGRRDRGIPLLPFVTFSPRFPGF